MGHDLVDHLNERRMQKDRLKRYASYIKDGEGYDLGHCTLMQMDLWMSPRDLVEYCRFVLIGPDKEAYAVQCNIDALLDCKSLRECVVKALSK